MQNRDLLFCFLLIMPVLASCSACTGCDLAGEGPDKEPGPGEVVWSYPISDLYGIKSEPAIDDGRVYIAADQHMRCFALRSGKLLWETRPPQVMVHLGNDLVHQDERRLYVDSGPRVTAFAKEDGTVLWHTELEGLSTYAFTRMAQTDRHLFVGDLGEVLRLTKADGLVDLRIPLRELRPDAWQQIAYNPVIADDGLLYVPTRLYQEEAEAKGGRLLVYEAGSGRFVWGFSVPPRKELLPGWPDSTGLDRDGHNVALTGNDVVFVTSSSVFALDRRTGKVHWEQLIEDGFGQGVAAGDGRAFASTSTGWISGRARCSGV